MIGKRLALSLFAICEVAAMSLWFSASAIVPSLRLEYTLTGHYAALLTSSVQASFVVGKLISAILGLADRVGPRQFFMIPTNLVIPR
jgi:hypothetical protein